MENNNAELFLLEHAVQYGHDSFEYKIDCQDRNNATKD